MTNNLVDCFTESKHWHNQASWNSLIGIQSNLNTGLYFGIRKEDGDISLICICQSEDYIEPLWNQVKSLTFAASLAGCNRAMIFHDSESTIPAYDWSVEEIKKSQEYREWINKIENQNPEEMIE